MKVVATMLWVVLFGLSASAQPVQWDWVKTSTGPRTVVGNKAIAADRFSNVYITGRLQDSLFFDDILATLNHGTQSNFFLVEYNNMGVPSGVKTGTGSLYSFGESVCNDKEGNVFVAGFFEGDLINFDTVTTSTAHHNGGNFFLVKYDRFGSAIWARSFHGTTQFRVSVVSDFSCVSVVADENGNTYLTGNFTDSTFILGNDTLLGSGGNFFVAKFSPAGDVLWLRGCNHKSSSFGSGIAMGNDNNLYVTGNFASDTLSFDGIISEPVTSAGIKVFVVKYDSLGNAIWARNSVGPGLSAAYSIAVDGSDNIYSTGFISNDSVRFGGQVLHPTYINDTTQAYLVKYDGEGNVIWAKSTDGPGINIGYNVVTSNDGLVHFSGRFGQDSILFANQTLYGPAVAVDPVFIYTLSGEGEIICADAIGSGGKYITGLCADSSSNNYLAGSFQNNGLTINSQVLNGNGNFVAKFKCDGVTGIMDVMQSGYLELLPNPVEGQGMIRYSVANSVQNSAVIIYDLLGRAVANYPIVKGEGELSINTGNYPSGIYFCSLVINGKPIVTQKMVVQK